jgi:hypothetical protein
MLPISCTPGNFVSYLNILAAFSGSAQQARPAGSFAQIKVASNCAAFRLRPGVRGQVRFSALKGSLMIAAVPAVVS